MPQKPAGEIEAAGAADATSGPPHQLCIDRLHQITKADVGLEARGRTRRRLNRIEPEDPWHDEALRFQFPPPVVPNVGIPGGVGLHEQQRPARSERGHLPGHDPRAVFLRGRHEQEHIAGGKHRLEEFAVVIAVARPGGAVCRLPAAMPRSLCLRVGVGAVDEHDVGDRRGVAADHAGIHRIDRQPGEIDVAGRDHHRIDRGRPRDVAGGAQVAAGQRVDQRALAGAGAADHADDEHPREFAAGAVEPRFDLFPFSPHRPGRRPLRQ